MASHTEVYDVTKPVLAVSSENGNGVRACLPSHNVAVGAETAVDDVTKPVGAVPDDDSDASSSDVVAERREESPLPQFGRLPGLVWVKVIQLLPLADRYRLSQVGCVCVWRSGGSTQGP